VPGNAIFSWDGKRTTVFLAPSGYQNFPIPASLREAGTNGLALGRGGLLVADSGTRVIARVDLATRQKTVLAESYQGKRFNSPNDLVVARNGDVYFTDPPFGLAGVQKSPLRELPYTGVFRLTTGQSGASDFRQAVAERHCVVTRQPHALRDRQYGLDGDRSRRFRHADRAAAVRRE
jgi:sugar lactone lactonase YvrE